MKLPPITINNDSKYYPDQVARMMREYAAAAYRAGQEEMRERAAKSCEELEYDPLAADIRALPVDA